MTQISQQDKQGAWDKLTAQNHRCALTGQEFNIDNLPGIDRINPRARGGAYTLDNIEWVSWPVNRAKRDLTRDEFIKLCGWVAAHNT